MNENPDPTNMEQRARADGKTEFTTYRRADGDLIYGEYAFVIHSEFFDDIDQPIDVIKETWVLETREVVKFEPYGWSDEDDDDPDITGVPS